MIQFAILSHLRDILKRLSESVRDALPPIVAPVPATRVIGDIKAFPAPSATLKVCPLVMPALTVSVFGPLYEETHSIRPSDDVEVSVLPDVICLTGDELPPPLLGAETHVDPFEVRTFPKVPGDTKATGDVPFPISTELASSVDWPVPPLGTLNTLPPDKHGAVAQ